MRYPLTLAVDLAKYIASKKLRGAKKYALTLTLDPLGARAGCSAQDTARQNTLLTVEECLAAVEECGAPVVCIRGGEPLGYPEIGRLANGILERGRHLFLCTDGTLIRRRLHMIRPEPHFFWNVQLDGTELVHDERAGRPGVFREALDGIKSAKNAGFLVCANTTIDARTDIQDVAKLYAHLHELHVDGYLISPEYVNAAKAGRKGAAYRAEMNAKFREAAVLLDPYNLLVSPIYMEYLSGERELSCAAWASPTYTPQGWSGPCRMVGEAQEKSYVALLENTLWENYGRGMDPRCEDCMASPGYEAAAVLGVNRKLGDTWKMLAWQFSRTMGERKEDAHQEAAGDASRHGDAAVHLPVTRKQNSNTGAEGEPELISGGKQAR